MAHSLQEYLQRQSTQTLEGILQICLQDVDNYGYVIPQIRAILAEREAEVRKKN